MNLSCCSAVPGFRDGGDPTSVTSTGLSPAEVLLDTVAGGRWDYPSALSVVDGESLSAAVNWVRVAERKVGGRVLIWTRSDSLDTGSLVRRFVAGCDDAVAVVDVEPSPDWPGGVVVALGARRDELLEWADDPRTRALCVVAPDMGEVGVWVAAAAPRLLGDTVLAERGPRRLSAVTVEALCTLDRLLPHPITLAAPTERRDAAAILQILHDCGEVLAADAMCLWAIEHRWSVAGATRLAALADSLDSRTAPDSRSDNPFQNTVVELWRERASHDRAEPIVRTTEYPQPLDW